MKRPRWKNNRRLLTLTCDSPAVLLLRVSGFSHPREDVFAHRKLGVVAFGPVGEMAHKRLRLRQMLVSGRLTGAAKPADIIQRLAGVFAPLDVLRGVGFLHFHEMLHRGPPFDLLTEHWQPNVTWQVSRLPRVSGLRGSRGRERERKKEGDRIREETT